MSYCFSSTVFPGCYWGSYGYPLGYSVGCGYGSTYSPVGYGFGYGYNGSGAFGCRRFWPFALYWFAEISEAWNLLPQTQQADFQVLRDSSASQLAAFHIGTRVSREEDEKLLASSCLPCMMFVGTFWEIWHPNTFYVWIFHHAHDSCHYQVVDVSVKFSINLSQPLLYSYLSGVSFLGAHISWNRQGGG